MYISTGRRRSVLKIHFYGRRSHTPETWSYGCISDQMVYKIRNDNSLWKRKRKEKRKKKHKTRPRLTAPADRWCAAKPVPRRRRRWRQHRHSFGRPIPAVVYHPSGRLVFSWSFVRPYGRSFARRSRSLYITQYYRRMHLPP